MALQRQPISIPFVEGIDTKTDEKMVQTSQGKPVLPARLLQFENGVFNKLGRLNKRNGYNILRQRIIDSTSSISAATGLASFANELNLFTGTKLYAFTESSDGWIEKGTTSSVKLETKSVVRNIYQQTNPDYGYNEGLGCYVWKDSVGGCRYTVIDETNGTIIAQNQSMSSTGISPRVIGIGRYFFIYYIESNTLKFRYIQISTPSTISAATDITTTIDTTDKIYDVQKLGERIYICYNDDDASKAIKLFYMTAGRTVSSEVTYAAEEALAISICGDTSNNVWVSYSNGAKVKYFIRDYTLATAILAKTDLETIANIRNVASLQTATNTVTFVYEKTNSPDNYVKKVTGTLAGVVGTPAVFVRSVGLGGKFFTYNSTPMVVLTHSSTLQSTYYVYTLAGDIVTKLQQNTGGGTTAASILPTVVEIDDGKFIFPTLQKGVLQTEDGVAFTSLGVTSTLIDFVSLNNFVTTELGNNLHIVGGILQSYDGASVNETGFNVFPEGVTVSETNAGAGTLTNGAYQYAVVYAWIDNQGQIHRSAPSIGPQLTVAAGPSKGTLVIPTLRISKKSNVFIEVYRTEVNSSTVYYKVTSNTSLTANDATVDTISYVDNTSDASLISGELLYTVGGELENICPPSSSVITNWKNRIALKPAEEQNVVLYSKIRTEGKPVEFNDSLRISVDAKGGDITALGVLDEKLIIFKTDRMFMQAGDGPNNLGEQSDFGLPDDISSDVGCVDVNSVVSTPVGLMFKSSKGIYLLNRGLATSYIGAEVEDYNDLRITSARVVPDVNQVRFTTEDGLCLVYDYFYKQWSTFTNHESVGATKYNGTYCFAKADGRVFKEDSTIFTDGAQSVKMRVTTSWFQLADVQGFQRFYKLLLMGDYKSNHKLKVRIGYNMETAFSQECVIDVPAVIDPTTYGEESPYGSEEVYGGEAPEYEWRIFPKRQKCKSFRISFEDVMTNVFGESFNMSNMRLEVGIKQGSNKSNSAHSAAAE